MPEGATSLQKNGTKFESWHGLLMAMWCNGSIEKRFFNFVALNSDDGTRANGSLIRIW